jgi:Putative viral replication protein/RNA helicase
MWSRWCFTLNNYTDAEVASLKDAECRYLVFGYEVGESGTPHLQGFICFNRTKRLTGCRAVLARAHWEPARGSNEQAAEYCKKEGAFHEKGAIPIRGKNSQLTMATQELVSGNSIKDIAFAYPVMYVRNFRGLREFANIVQSPYEHESVRGIWVVGRPGTGKSRYARTFDSVYLKPQNKWWDGYNGEETVILDDFDKGGVGLGHLLKIWTDRYACTGETKGGTTHLRHKRFIITSNYRIEDIFGDEREIVRAIIRRFQVLDFDMFPYDPMPTDIDDGADEIALENNFNEGRVSPTGVIDAASVLTYLGI